jgi:hypothetical protein
MCECGENCVRQVSRVTFAICDTAGVGARPVNELELESGEVGGSVRGVSCGREPSTSESMKGRVFRAFSSFFVSFVVMSSGRQR